MIILSRKKALGQGDRDLVPFTGKWDKVLVPPSHLRPSAFISAGILISIFGALNGYLMSGVRMPYAMATDNLIPFKGFFGKLGGSKTPVNSLIFESVLAMIYATTGSFDLLTNLAVFVLWIFFTMAVFGVFILRSKHKEIERPYKVPLFPIVPIIGIIGGIFIVVNTLFTDTANALYGLGVSVIGIPIYIMLKKRKK
jgi:APA family basic amino acid/polyamine antiporter